MQASNARLIVVVAAVAAVALGAAGAQAQAVRKDTFPKIGGLHFNGALYGEASHRANVAKLDLAVVGMWRGWEMNGMTVADVFADIRSRADAAGNQGLILAKITNIMQSHDSPDDAADRDIWDKMNAEKGPGGAAIDWWARNSAGEHIRDNTWPMYLTNITRFVVPDTNGDRVPEWMAKRDYRVFFRDIPEIDAWYLDNFFWRPRVTADWNGDGVDDSKNDPMVQRWYRYGMVDWMNEVGKLRPDILVMGNVDGQIGTGSGMLSEPEYKGKLGGALFEGAMGKPWSIETNHSWEDMMRFYRNLLANTKAPHIVLFGAIAGDAQDYQMLRYALTSALMDDGYLAFNVGGYREVQWYDEFDLAGTAGTDWLGKALSEPPTAPWSKGVYRRDFENGIALVNPKGNGTQTITVEPGFVRIAGVQDPLVNNGQVADTITLPERDGILLVRKNRKVVEEGKPNPPLLSLQ